MNKVVASIMDVVDKRWKVRSDQSLPDVSNQSFATDKVLSPLETGPKVNDSSLFGKGEGHLVHRTCHVSHF